MSVYRRNPGPEPSDPPAFGTAAIVAACCAVGAGALLVVFTIATGIIAGAH